MKTNTIQELYNSFKAGQLTPQSFAYQLRKGQYAGMFSSYNTFPEMITILKNKKVIFEAMPKAEAKTEILMESFDSSPTVDQHQYRLGVTQETELDSDPIKTHDKIVANIRKNPTYYTDKIEKGQAFLQESEEVDTDEDLEEALLNKLDELSPETYLRASDKLRKDHSSGDKFQASIDMQRHAAQTAINPNDLSTKIPIKIEGASYYISNVSRKDGTIHICCQPVDEEQRKDSQTWFNITIDANRIAIGPNAYANENHKLLAIANPERVLRYFTGHRDSIAYTIGELSSRDKSTLLRLIQKFTPDYTYSIESFDLKKMLADGRAKEATEKQTKKDNSFFGKAKKAVGSLFKEGDDELNELSPETYKSAAGKAEYRGQNTRSREFSKAATNATLTPGKPNAQKTISINSEEYTINRVIEIDGNLLSIELINSAYKSLNSITVRPDEIRMDEGNIDKIILAHIVDPFSGGEKNRKLTKITRVTANVLMKLIKQYRPDWGYNIDSFNIEGLHEVKLDELSPETYQNAANKAAQRGAAQYTTDNQTPPRAGQKLRRAGQASSLSNGVAQANASVSQEFAGTPLTKGKISSVRLISGEIHITISGYGTQKKVNKDYEVGANKAVTIIYDTKTNKLRTDTGAGIPSLGLQPTDRKTIGTIIQKVAPSNSGEINNA